MAHNLVIDCPLGYFWNFFADLQELRRRNIFVNCIAFIILGKATVDLGIYGKWRLVYKHIKENTKPLTFIK